MARVLTNVYSRIVFRIARIVGWTPLGKRVKVSIIESEETIKGGIGEELAGRIEALSEAGFEKTFLPRPERLAYICALIELDRPFAYKGGSFRWIVASPRHFGAGFYGLWLSRLEGVVVDAFCIDRPIIPSELLRKDVAAICLVKLVRQ